MANLGSSSTAHMDYAKKGLNFISKHKVSFLLFVAILLSLHTHWMVMREWHMPTYGNTMIHIASARHVIEKGDYPVTDYSYGGGIPNLYVPGYRILVAVLVLLTGFSLDFASRFIVLIFAAMVPPGFFILGKRLFGSGIGILAAFASVLPGEFLIYTVRPLPQAFGLILLPIAFHAFYTKNYRAALMLAFAVTLVHQEAIAFLVGGLGVYFGFIILHLIWKVMVSRGFDAEKHSALLKNLLLGILFSMLVYLIWQFAIIGHFNIFELAQFKNHEGNVVSMDSYILKTGSLIATFAMAGIFVCAGYFLKYAIGDHPGIPEELRPGLRSFIMFLLGAFGSYFVLNNFSLSRGASMISISFPIALGPLGSFEIGAISLFVGLFGVLLLKILDRSENYLKFPNIAYLFLFALFFAGFVAVKNDAIGLRVFMDRFLVYLQIPLIILAALGADSLLEFVKEFPKRYLLGKYN